MNINMQPLWQFLLALFLVIYGLTSLTNLSFVMGHVIMGVLALAAGVLWFVGGGGK